MDSFRFITYNVDGLPEKLDLNTLPWFLKPIAWIYKLIKGTTLVNVNDNLNKKEKTLEISKRINGADIICVQEDFNYHDELVSELKDYNMGTHLGGFNLSNLFSNIKLFPYPRFKSDGLNIFVKKPIEIIREKIIPWEHSRGYFSHANDKLTTKGFRHYVLKKNDLFFEVYIVHMDADFYHPEKCPNVQKDIETRKKQLKQLTSYILFHRTGNPIIILGDTNSSRKYGWDIHNIKEYLINPINANRDLSIIEFSPTDYTDVDRFFYLDVSYRLAKMGIDECHVCKDFGGLSDHYPLEVNLKLLEKK